MKNNNTLLILAGIGLFLYMRRKKHPDFDNYGRENGAYNAQSNRRATPITQYTPDVMNIRRQDGRFQ